MSSAAIRRSTDTLTIAARQRVIEKTAERAVVLRAVHEGRLLLAEPDRARAIQRVQAITGLSQKGALLIMENAPVAQFELSGEVRYAAERIQGDTADFVGTSFLELARAAARTVGRVVSRGDLGPRGSGFLIAPGLFLTNNHVISSAAAARELIVQLNYELDIFGQPKQVTSFEFEPAKFFFTSEVNKLDFTVLALGERSAGNGDFSEFGYCPLLNTDDKHVLGECVNIIQHPEGDFKQVVIRENRLVSRFPTVLHYVADTKPGSSGAPVFNDQFEAVALHHWGEPFTQTTNPDGSALPKNVNEGIRISAVVEEVTRASAQFNAEAKKMLDPVLNPPFRYPSTAAAPIRENIARPAPQNLNGRSNSSAISAERQNETTIKPMSPVTITISIEGDGISSRSQPAANLGAERIKIDF